MKKQPLFFVICVLCSATCRAADYENVTFTLVNSTGFSMTAFYISPPDTHRWEEDVLGIDVLKNGEQVDITLADGRPDCNYDFKAVFSDGSELIDEGTVCNGEIYTYEPPEQSHDAVSFTLLNKTGTTMVGLYLSPPSTNKWEENVLGKAALKDGERIEVTIDDDRPDCDYDFKATFVDGSQLIDKGTVCDGETYTYTRHETLTPAPSKP